MSIINFNNVTYSYKSEEEGISLEPALRGVDLEIEEGTFVAILGHNGSGKSTLAKHFNGILVPDDGAVTAFGMDTADEDMLIDIRRRVGMVFQNPDNQIVSNVVEEDVAFAPENLGVEPKEIRRRVDKALDMVGMYNYRLHAPHLLSGGQKQRIAIAGVLAMAPKCIVFDEPTAMLDPGGREDIVKIIRELREEHGVAVVLITHHMEETVHADRLIVMDGGNIVMDGKPCEIFTHVEELKALGLTVPETTELIWELNKKGFNLPLEALTVEECAQALFSVLKE
ncbi:MAG: energy-coupling factor transporter ATPase [Ruminococcaceae bacterium]|nr:energy-coupling factor transporter ATPase [Oscillospiraceae bacterium]